VLSFVVISTGGGLVLKLMLIFAKTGKGSEGVLANSPAETLTVIVMLAAIVGLIGYAVFRIVQQERAGGVLEYGHLVVVTLGIAAVLMVFLVTMLLTTELFQDPAEVLAILTALFGVIGTLVGTYFGVKASSDARQGLQDVATGASTSLAVIAVTPPRDAENVDPNTDVTATFSNDLDPTSIKGTSHFTLVRIDTTEGTAHTPVDGTVDYGQPNFAPRVGAFVLPEAANLENDHTYQATITKGVRDLTGNTLAEDYAWQFKVRP